MNLSVLILTKKKGGEGGGGEEARWEEGIIKEVKAKGRTAPFLFSN